MKFDKSYSKSLNTSSTCAEEIYYIIWYFILYNICTYSTSYFTILYNKSTLEFIVFLHSVLSLPDIELVKQSLNESREWTLRKTFLNWKSLFETYSILIYVCMSVLVVSVIQYIECSSCTTWKPTYASVSAWVINEPRSSQVYGWRQSTKKKMFTIAIIEINLNLLLCSNRIYRGGNF